MSRQRRNAALEFAWAVLACSATLAPGRADVPPAPETRIAFKRGAVEAEAHGTLTSLHDALRFRVRAQANQHMRLVVDAPGATRGFVSFPNGQEVGSPGAAFFDDTLPVDGDYRIRIIESPMGEAWQGNVTLHLYIK